MNKLMLAIATLAIFTVGCNRSSVNLSYTNASNEVPVLGNLVFRFSEPLATDSMLNRWDSTDYISFSPAIKGRFRWENKSELIFSPSAPLQPATNYTADFSDKRILGSTEYSNIEKADKITFRTPDLVVEQQYFSWAKPEGGTAAIPAVELQFNYPVSAEAVKGKIKVLLDEKEVQTQFSTAGISPVMRLLLPGVKAEDRDYKVAVVVQQGLTPEGGKNGLAADLTYDGHLPSPFVLDILEVTTEHSGTSGSVFIRTSQSIADDVFSSLITIDPTVKYSVEKSDQGLLITSENIDVANSYAITIKKGLRGKLGGVLKSDYEAQVTFGELEPSLSFANGKAVYLSAAGQRNLELRITNIEKIKVVVSKVYENNLITAERYGYYPKNSDEEYYYEEDNGGTFGDVLYEQEIDTRNLPKYGAGRLFTFNPEDKLPGYKGIYHIQVRSTEDYWRSSSRFIALSDIGLIAKSGAGKMLVAANSLQTSQPLSGVGIQVYGANNQLIGNGSTNSSGFAEITLEGDRAFDGFKPAMVIAKLADDFNYLPFHNTSVNTSRYQVGGKRINSTGMDAFIAPERDMYRPGETMHFAVIMRDANRKNPGALPVKIKMLMPNGKPLTELRKTLDAEGVTEAAIPLSPTTITGSYTMELYNGNDVLITTHTFKVEEFVPDRIKVTAKLDKEILAPGTTSNLQINAVNYFGPPAAGRNYETEIQVKAKAFKPEAFSNFDFSLSNATVYFDKILKQGKTDADGNALETFTVPATYDGMGLLQARFFATVFDENGRPVSRNVTADILTQQALLGIGNGGYNYFSLNQPASFPLIALNKQEKPVATTAQVTIIKREYRTVLQRSGDYFRYESEPEDRQMVQKNIQVQGTNTVFSFIPREPGEYEMRVGLPGSKTYISREFYSYGSWGNTASSFEVKSDGEIDIVADKKVYKNGDNVKLLFKAPFDGKMLVTLEAAEVLTYQWVELKNRSASIDLPLGETHVPNAYVTATLFKPHSTSQIPLTAAHGFTNLTVKDETKRIGVSIKAAATSRSNKKQQVTVKASPGAMVNLAAVDNGILAVSGFRTPDPYDWYFGKRALGVNAWDVYPLLFPELRRSISSTGGDGDLSMDLRQNPIPNKRFKLLSYWSGWTKANGNGEASFTVDIPAFNGQVRLMAMSASGDKFGAAEATMQVADPLVMSTSMPRFITPGDTVLAGITLSNTTSKATTVTAKITVEGPLQYGTGANLETNIGAQSEGRIEFPIYALNVPGAAKLTITATGMGERFTEEIDITVRPASTLQRRTGSGVMNGGQQQAVSLPLSDFMQGTQDYSVVVGRSPVLQLGTPLRYLVNYPHGCTEQTISAAFPQLYFSSLSQLMNEGATFKGAANLNIQAAMQKIKMRQLYNGGLTFWDGEGTESWWVTAYAAHFLIESRKAGYAPDTKLLETMLQYLSSKLRRRDLVDYYYNNNQQKRIAPKEVAYSLYVLALAGRANVSSMNYYKANQKDLALDSRYVLAATYALAGDKKSYREMLPASFAGEEAVATGNGSLYSSIRDEGLALNVLLEVEPTNPQVPVMANHLVQKLNQQKYFSTQEAVFSLLALGKMAKQAANATSTADIMVNGKKVGSMTGENIRLTKKQLGAGNISLNTKGSGKLYYWWQASGISSTGQFIQEDNYLKVRRQLMDRYGKPLNGNVFRQNDLIVVKITLEKSYNGILDNVVVTDLLPGGWEIENARIKDLPGMDWIKDETTPISRDVRDDRIHLFTNMGSNKQVFYYSVRAVTPGNYHIGPLSADAMYNGEYHSYHGAGMIRVVR